MKIRGTGIGKAGAGNGSEARAVPNARLDTDLDATISRIQAELASSPDLIVRKFTLRIGQQLPVAAIYLDTVSDKETVNDFVMRSPMSPFLPEVPENADSPEAAFRYICVNALAVGQIEVIDSWTTMLLELLTGKTILLVNGWSECIAGNTIGGEKRAVSEASTQVVIRGPKDSFSESIATNIALVRRRIRSAKFGFGTVKIGTVTQTTVAMLYIEGIAKDEIRQEVRSRLNRRITNNNFSTESNSVNGKNRFLIMRPRVTAARRPSINSRR